MEPNVIDYADLMTRLAMDCVALGAVLATLAWRRIANAELVGALTVFNLGLFAVMSVISSADLGVGAGFGLFAVLSIIRLRSELFGNAQLAFVFSTLALGLVTGIPGLPLPQVALLCVLVTGALALTAAPRAVRGTQTCTVTIDSREADPQALPSALNRRLGLEVVSATVLSVDLVRETAEVSVRHRVASEAPPPAPTHVPGATQR